MLCFWFDFENPLARESTFVVWQSGHFFECFFFYEVYIGERRSEGGHGGAEEGGEVFVGDGGAFVCEERTDFGGVC